MLTKLVTTAEMPCEGINMARRLIDLILANIRFGILLNLPLARAPGLVTLHSSNITACADTSSSTHPSMTEDAGLRPVPHDYEHNHSRTPTPPARHRPAHCPDLPAFRPTDFIPNSSQAHQSKLYSRPPTICHLKDRPVRVTHPANPPPAV